MSGTTNASNPDAFNNWLKLKDVQEKVIILLDQLDQARGRKEEILQEVGVSLAAIDMMLEVRFVLLSVYIFNFFYSFYMSWSYNSNYIRKLFFKF